MDLSGLVNALHDFAAVSAASQSSVRHKLDNLRSVILR